MKIASKWRLLRKGHEDVKPPIGEAPENKNLELCYLKSDWENDGWWEKACLHKLISFIFERKVTISYWKEKPQIRY